MAYFQISVIQNILIHCQCSTLTFLVNREEVFKIIKMKTVDSTHNTLRQLVLVSSYTTPLGHTVGAGHGI